jgi:large subunit ribosomal protein L6
MGIRKNTRYTIRIPDKINLFYSETKKIIIFKGPQTQKSLKIKTKLRIKKNELEVTAIPLSKMSNNLQKTLKENQGTIIALIKQLLTDASTITYKKLKLRGIGYRAFLIDQNLLLLKLGYSHPIYFKTPKNLEIFSLKLTKLFLSSNSYQSLTSTASLIRSKKLPEPYKGKGILYENEKIKLKEGKKI